MKKLILCCSIIAVVGFVQAGKHNKSISKSHIMHQNSVKNNSPLKDCCKQTVAIGLLATYGIWQAWNWGYLNFEGDPKPYKGPFDDALLKDKHLLPSDVGLIRY